MWSGVEISPMLKKLYVNVLKRFGVCSAFSEKKDKNRELKAKLHTLQHGVSGLIALFIRQAITYYQIVDSQSVHFSTYFCNLLSSGKAINFICF